MKADYPDNPLFRGRGAAHARYMLGNVIRNDVRHSGRHLAPLRVLDQDPGRLSDRCAEIIRKGIESGNIHGI